MNREGIEIIDRLDALNMADPEIDTAAIERAFDTHFQRLKLEPLPVVICADYLAARRMVFKFVWDKLGNEIERAAIAEAKMTSWEEAGATDQVRFAVERIILRDQKMWKTLGDSGYYDSGYASYNRGIEHCSIMKEGARVQSAIMHKLAVDHIELAMRHHDESYADGFPEAVLKSPDVSLDKVMKDATSMAASTISRFIDESGWAACNIAAKTAGIIAELDGEQVYEHAEIWRPMIDAVTAGVWAYWVVGGNVVVMPRPHLRLERHVTGSEEPTSAWESNRNNWQSSTGTNSWTRNSNARQMATVRLHNASGPAVFWPKGLEFFYIHGVPVDRHVVMEPQKIKLSEITSQRNIEVRRVIIEKYGQGRYLLECGAKPVHTDDFGTLYRAEVDNDEPLVMVKVVNATPEGCPECGGLGKTGEPEYGTEKPCRVCRGGKQKHFRDFFLRVPPSMRTAKEAVAWTFRIDEKDYKPQAQT